jgi:hypothetical protein
MQPSSVPNRLITFVGAVMFCIIECFSAQSPGTWTEVPLPGAPPGLYSIWAIADPLNNNVAYAFGNTATSFNTGGNAYIYKTNDAGLTWNLVTTPFAVSCISWVELDRSRTDPQTPPTFWMTLGNGGLTKSTDGGVTWTTVNATLKPLIDPLMPYGLDTYGVHLDPKNGNHLIVTFHYGFKTGDGGLAESNDGGATWTLHPAYSGFGVSHYVTILDSTTWLCVGQDPGPVWRTTTAGRVNGVPSFSAWTNVLGHGHLHGGWEPCVDTTNHAIYFALIAGGLWRSGDNGVTWKNEYDGTPNNQWVGCSVTMVGQDLWADIGASYGINFIRASRSDPTTWTPQTPPAGMKNGFVWGDGVYDGKNWILLSPEETGNVWRYVEVNPSTKTVTKTNAKSIQNKENIAYQISNVNHGQVMLSKSLTKNNELANLQGQVISKQ